MRESPSVFYGERAAGFARKPLTRLLPDSSQTHLPRALRGNKADLGALQKLASAFRQNFAEIPPSI
ncbi:MAG: hypothetical protein ACREDJ_05345 [Methylocella sp.]